jgi:hypothetical protein
MSQPGSERVKTGGRAASSNGYHRQPRKTQQPRDCCRLCALLSDAAVSEVTFN